MTMNTLRKYKPGILVSTGGLVCLQVLGPRGGHLGAGDLGEAEVVAPLLALGQHHDLHVAPHGVWLHDGHLAAPVPAQTARLVLAADHSQSE